MTGTPLSSRRVDAGVFCLVCLLGAILHSRASPPGELCENPRNGSPSCVCEHANGIIDLSPLALQNGSARFIDVGPDRNNYLYNYNPCYPFTDPCGIGYVCEHQGDNHYLVGDEGTESIYIDSDGKIYAYYTAPTEPGTKREAFVELICDQGYGSGRGQLTTTGDRETELQYQFTLRSCHACPGGCQSGNSNSTAVFIGIGAAIGLLLIIALVLLIIGAIIWRVHFRNKGPAIAVEPQLYGPYGTGTSTQAN